MPDATHTEGKLEALGVWIVSIESAKAVCRMGDYGEIKPYRPCVNATANKAELVRRWNHLPEVEAERDRLLDALGSIKFTSGLVHDEENGWNAQQRHRLSDIHKLTKAAIAKSKESQDG